MVKRLLLLLLIVADLYFSFRHYYHSQIDGDFANIVLPDDSFEKVLADPFGLKAVIDKEVYIAPNRYFAHQSMIAYFKSIPFYLQYFTDPITSVYLACALIRLLTHISFLLIFATMITGVFKPLSTDSLLVMAIITPFFQSCGFEVTMGIINPCITYFFFYGLPLLFLLIVLYPFYRFFYEQKTVNYNYASVMLWIALAIYISLNGPLVPGVILLAVPLLLYQVFTGKLRSNLPVNVFLILLLLLSGYSIYVGRYNEENFFMTMPLEERYLRLPIGIAKLFFGHQSHLELPILLSFVVLNYLLILFNSKGPEGKKILALMRGLAVFSILYLLMLPLGGFRYYRPYIVRSDTFLPVTVLLIFMAAISAFFILRQFSGKSKWIYSGVLILFISYFALNDVKNKFDNSCQRKAIAKIAASDEKLIKLEEDCTIWQWDPLAIPEDSENPAMLMHYYGITKDLKMFYQPSDLK